MEKSKGNSLGKEQTLGVSEYLESGNKNYRLTLQSDGNLVLYSNIMLKNAYTTVIDNYTKVLWATNIFNKDGKKIDCLRMQSDGNLVLYYQGGKEAAWATGTNSAKADTSIASFLINPIIKAFDKNFDNSLVLQDDGNLVIYNGNRQPVWASCSCYPANWMSTTLNDNLTLKQICMPGSHDAGMYQTTQEYAPGLALCQGESVLAQLRRGIRYFDFRTQYWSSNRGDERFYIHHGLATGPLLINILKDIQEFYNNGCQETVILSFGSHKDFPTKDEGKSLSPEKSDYIRLIHKYLGRYTLPIKFSNTNFNEVSLSDLRGKIIITVQFSEGEFNEIDNECHGFFRDSSRYIYEKYAETKYYGTMWKHQADEFSSFADKNRLFLLNWTLTPDDGAWGTFKTITQSYTSVKTYAEEINPHLTNWGDARSSLFPVNSHGNIVNIINGDFWNVTGHKVLDACYEVMAANLKAVKK